MKITASIKDLQLARDAIKKEVSKVMTSKVATIGIHADAGEHEGGITNAQLGALLNYGNPLNKMFGKPAPIPARPWLIPGVESGKREQMIAFAEVFGRTQSGEKALAAAATVATGNVQQYMTDLKDPPNSAVTIERKGSSNPLIDTGALRASVTWKISSKSDV